MPGGWTVLFAVCVGWLTNSRRDQILTTTAAYCAVLVVFSCGTLGGVAKLPTPEYVVLVDWNCTRVGYFCGSFSMVYDG